MNELVSIDSEIAQIEGLMRTDRTAYNRDEGAQARYRELLARRHGGHSLAEPDSDGEGLVRLYSQKEYADEHGTTEGFADYVRLVRRAADFVGAVPAGEREAFRESIESWPQDLADAAFAEIMRQPFGAGLSDPETMALFAELPEGRIAMREWGAEAPRYHATLRARMDRIMDAVDDWHVRIFRNWHDNLSPKAKVAVYRMLLR